MTKSYIRYVVCIAVAIAAAVAAEHVAPPLDTVLRLAGLALALLALWVAAVSRDLLAGVWIARRAFRDELAWIDGDWRVVRP